MQLRSGLNLVVCLLVGGGLPELDVRTVFFIDNVVAGQLVGNVLSGGGLLAIVGFESDMLVFISVQEEPGILALHMWLLRCKLAHFVAVELPVMAVFHVAEYRRELAVDAVRGLGVWVSLGGSRLESSRRKPLVVAPALLFGLISLLGGQLALRLFLDV